LDIKIGRTAAALRERLGLTQKEMADALDITVVHLSNIENNHSAPSHALIEKCRKKFGVDLYVLAWCTHGNVARLPLPLRSVAKKLREALERQIPEGFLPARKNVNG
jgi:transcriptional regulator with XRE-family HTH domain